MIWGGGAQSGTKTSHRVFLRSFFSPARKAACWERPHILGERLCGHCKKCCILLFEVGFADELFLLLHTVAGCVLSLLHVQASFLTEGLCPDICSYSSFHFCFLHFLTRVLAEGWDNAVTVALLLRCAMEYFIVGTILEWGRHWILDFR